MKALALCLSLVGSTVFAHTMSEVEQTCPLDGTKWKEMMDMSGTSFGMQLDLRPIGPTPAPWRIAVCPKDHFPIYKEKFAADEIADFRAWVKTPEYQAIAKETSYYLTARAMLHRHGRPLAIAHVLLKATWQVGPGEQYRRYATEALAQFKEAIGQQKTHGDEWLTAELVAVELERRTERWDEAAARIASVRNDKAMQAELPKQVLDKQARLIAAHDSAPHPVSDER
jgi:hypothetical protein